MISSDNATVSSTKPSYKSGSAVQKALGTLAGILWAASATTGCMATQADIDEAEAELAGQGEVASTQEALTRGGNNAHALANYG